MAATSTARNIPYQRLEKDTIRLLRLYPRPSSSTSWTHQLECDLEHVTLDAVHDGTVSFQALSYEWKSLLCAQRIFIRAWAAARQQQEWFPIQVRDNLYRALWEIAASPHWPRSGALIWVDAVCINQSDEKEKSEQVKRMGSLYSLATGVIVWLGVADRKADDGFAYFAKVRAPLSRKWKDEVASPADSGWQGVIELHNRSYWRRLWIIQEFANAKDIEIRCGSHRISWKDWMYATKVLTEALSRIPYGTQTAIETSSAYMIQSIRELDQRFRSLDYVLNVSFEAECLNPIDRIYGIIGMINTDPLTEPVYPYEYQSIVYGRRAYNPDSHYQLPRAPKDVYSTPELTIDYSKGVWDVYADVMHYHSDYPYQENRLAKTGNPPRTMRLSQLVQHALGIQMLTPPELPDESATSFLCIRAEGSERDTVHALGPLLTAELTESEISNWIKSQGLFSSPSSEKSLARISSQIERLKTSGHLAQVQGVVKTTDPNTHILLREHIHPMLVCGRHKNLAIVPSKTEPGDTLCQFQHTDICVVATTSRLAPTMAVSSYIPLSGDQNIFHASIHMANANEPAILVGRALILRMPAEVPRKISQLKSTQMFDFSVPPLHADQSVKMECSLRALQFLSFR